MSEAGPRALVVEGDYDGSRLDNFLTALLPEQSRSHIQRLIKDGRVTGPSTPSTPARTGRTPGAPAVATLRPSTPVRAGQVYAVDVPPPAARGQAAAARANGRLRQLP